MILGFPVAAGCLRRRPVQVQHPAWPVQSQHVEVIKGSD